MSFTFSEFLRSQANNTTTLNEHDNQYQKNTQSQRRDSFKEMLSDKRCGTAIFYF
jgi:hypothetical protein